MGKKIKITILLIMFLFFGFQTFSQQSIDMIKYWYYRNRLQYFVVLGDGPGESQVATIKNSWKDSI